MSDISRDNAKQTSFLVCSAVAATDSKTWAWPEHVLFRPITTVGVFHDFTTQW